MDRLTKADLNSLHEICPGGVVQNADLASISQWCIGGCADLVLQPSSRDDVAALRNWFSNRGIRPLFIGLTSNLLFSSEGLRVPCIQIGSRMGAIAIDGSEVQAQAGAWVPGLARSLMKAGLSGVEHICGIPGTLGGLIYMNGGSLRQAIGTHVISVESVSADGEIATHSAAECGFSYRHSAFQCADRIVTGAELHLQPRERSEIRAEMLNILSKRRCKFPRKLPNCGSTFTSDPALYEEYGPPGAIIESLGLKGRQIGGARISELHANFLVNTGGAQARDVLDLIAEINQAVRAKTGKTMLAEVRYVFPDGRTSPASEVAENRGCI